MELVAAVEGLQIRNGIGPQSSSLGIFSQTSPSALPFLASVTSRMQEVSLARKIASFPRVKT